MARSKQTARATKPTYLLGEELDPGVGITDEGTAEYLAEHHGIRLTDDAIISMEEPDDEDMDPPEQVDTPSVMDLMELVNADRFGNIPHKTGDPSRMYMIKIVDGPVLVTYNDDTEDYEPILFGGDEIRIYSDKASLESQVDPHDS